MKKFPGVTAAALAALAVLDDDNDDDISIVVVFTTGPKKYAYYTNGEDIQKGDSVLVPTKSGNDLTAQVVLVSKAKRWASLRTRTVIHKE